MTLLEKKPRLVYDQVGRAYGVLANARTISSKEALNLLSMVRMGVDMEFFPAATRGVVDEMIIISQPAHIQKAAERKLTAEERDVFRADLIRERLKDMAKPRIEDTWPPNRGQTEAA